MLQTIRHGDSGDAVKIAQYLIGYSERGQADGEYTAYMVSAVCAWQKTHSCDPDGVIGPVTWRAIAKAAPTCSTGKNKYSAATCACQILVDVNADGIYGTKTKLAVAAYQTSAQLDVDGICGPKTWGALIVGEEEKPQPTPGEQPVNYKQYDSRWAKVMYSNHGDKSQTIKSSGCGPTSGADIVATWWDASITPVEMCEQSLEWGCRTYSSGTTSTFFKKLAQKYGATYYTTSSMDTVIKCLQNGGLVVVCFGKGKWTSQGHYCVIWKYDGTNFHINDPASAAEKRAIGTYSEVKAQKKGFYCFEKGGEQDADGNNT